MAHIDWSKLEGRSFKVDVGTTRASALESYDETILYICTDGAIVMNQEVIGERMTQATFNEGTGASTYGTISGEDVYHARYAYEKITQLVAPKNSDEYPPIKATDNGDSGYTIALWQDGNTYTHGTTIPLASGSGGGIMSAEAYETLDQIAEWYYSYDETKYLTKTDAAATYMPLSGGTFTGNVTLAKNKTITLNGSGYTNNLYIVPIATTSGRSYRLYYQCYVNSTQYYAYTELGTDRVLVTDGTLTAFKVAKPLLVGSQASYTDTTTSTFMTNIVVGSSSVNRNVTINGTLTAKSVVQSTTSDVRMKENLNADFDALAKLAELGEVYAFDYKDEAHSHSYGLIAQNVIQNAEFADMVGQREEDGMYYVNYLDPRLTALLLKAVKQLKEELDELKNKQS